MKQKIGKSLKRTKVDPISPPRPVELHLVVTRANGDTERYKLGEVKDLRYAIEYRKRLSAVKLPRRLKVA